MKQLPVVHSRGPVVMASWGGEKSKIPWYGATFSTKVLSALVLNNTALVLRRTSWVALESLVIEVILFDLSKTHFSLSLPRTATLCMCAMNRMGESHPDRGHPVLGPHVWADMSPGGQLVLQQRLHFSTFQIRI